LPPEYGLDLIGFPHLGECRETHHLPLLLRQDGAGEAVPRATPRGHLVDELGRNHIREYISNAWI
jgi:hypothetical protein